MISRPGDCGRRVESSLRAFAVERFRYLRIGLAAILIFFGARLLLADILEFPNWVSLAVIAAALALAVIASIKWPGTRPTVRPGDDAAA